MLELLFAEQITQQSNLTLTILQLHWEEMLIRSYDLFNESQD